MIATGEPLEDHHRPCSLGTRDTTKPRGNHPQIISEAAKFTSRNAPDEHLIFWIGCYPGARYITLDASTGLRVEHKFDFADESGRILE